MAEEDKGRWYDIEETPQTRKFMGPPSGEPANPESVDFSQVGSAIAGAGKEKRKENWEAFAHGGLIALDLASFGSLGAARSVGGMLRERKKGPQDRELTTPEKIQVELQILAVQKADADAKAARLSGNRQAIVKADRETAIEQAKLDAMGNREDIKASARVATEKIKAKSSQIDTYNEKMLDTLARLDGEINAQEQKVVDEYTARFEGQKLTTTDYQDAVVEFADTVKGMNPVDIDNMLDQMGDVGLMLRDAADPESENEVLQKDESVIILRNKIQQGSQAKLDLKSTIPGLNEQVTKAKQELDQLGVGRTKRVVIGEDGKEQIIYEDASGGGETKLDLSYIRKLANNIPDVRPESQKMIEAVRETAEYKLGMEEIGLNPANAIDREIYEEESRKQMRKVKRIKKRALRKGVPIEQLPQFQEYLAEVKAGGQGAPKLSSMRKQLLLMYAGVDVDAVVGPRGQGIMGEDLEALPEAGAGDAGLVERGRDELMGNLGRSSRYDNLRGVGDQDLMTGEIPLMRPGDFGLLEPAWTSLSDEQKAELADLGIYGPEGGTIVSPETNPFGTKRDPREQGIEKAGEYIPTSERLSERGQRGPEGVISGREIPLGGDAEGSVGGPEYDPTRQSHSPAGVEESDPTYHRTNPPGSELERILRQRNPGPSSLSSSTEGPEPTSPDDFKSVSDQYIEKAGPLEATDPRDLSLEKQEAKRQRIIEAVQSAAG